MTPKLSILGELDGAISRLREQVQGHHNAGPPRRI